MKIRDTLVKRQDLETDLSNLSPTNHRTIVYLRDFQSILKCSQGQTAHQTFLDIVQNQRKSGASVVLIRSDVPLGSCAASPVVCSCQICRDRADAVFSDCYYVIKIPVPDEHHEREILQAAKEARIRQINLRNIQVSIRQRGHVSGFKLEYPSDVHLNPDLMPIKMGLHEEIWERDKVLRVSSVAMGQSSKSLLNHPQGSIKLLSIAEIATAVSEILKVDDETRKEENVASNDPTSLSQKIRDNCNPHEKKILDSLVEPDGIDVRFSDIIAPESTSRIMKTLVGLPLSRPDAFSYGVLSKNFINGVLLFGPPGTGKTMMAKAVAKECGARMLEVKGSEVYDMLVGEGEKNVKAIFSLARKTRPCVVFLDEVDSIFATRSTTTHLTTHRQIINQFMSEWDGINALNPGVLILAATNRPFDLDDAILRRMPRRIFFDLPTEEDRLAILKLLLSDETLDPKIDLASIAKYTSSYSGSDLKNVCVSAAILAVTEQKVTEEVVPPDEIKINSSSVTPVDMKTGTQEKRVLLPQHFERALEEVRASVSENMESIKLLRRFAREYGSQNGEVKSVNRAQAKRFGDGPGHGWL